jgi:hypothetical protein
MDPFSAALAAAPLLREALEKLRNANVARRFFYKLRDALEQDNHIPQSVRGALAEQAFYLLADPNFQGALDDYLERFDTEGAASEIETFVRPLVEELVEPQETASVIDAVMRDIHRAANRAQETDRDATLLQAERVLEAVRMQGEQMFPIALLDLEWAPDWPQKALASLGRESPGELAQLKERVGSGEDLATVKKRIREPDEWTQRASAHVWIALARFAEHHGEWLLGREAWERALTNPPDNDPIPILMHVAMNASIAGDEDAYVADLERARAIDKDHPRLRLEEVSHTDPPEVQLERLSGLSFPEPEIRAVLEARRAIAYLMLGDLPSAREHLDRGREHNRDAIQVRMVGAHIEVYEARDAVSEAQPIDAKRLEAVVAECADLRSNLLKQKRFEEAASVLMLAVDASTIRGDHQHAVELLRSATSEELALGAGDEILAEAAVRAREPLLALELLDNPKPDSLGRRRVRAYANVFNPSVDRERVVADLDDLVVGSDSDERFSAALGRVLASAMLGAEWSDEAEQILSEKEASAAVAIKAVALIRAERYDEAESTLGPNANEPWAAELLFRVADDRGDLGEAGERARQFLERHVPSQDLRLAFADTFVRIKDVSRARAELRQLAKDDRCPVDVRKKAFRRLAELAPDPIERFEVLEEWRQALDDPEVEQAFADFGERLRD